MSNADELSYIHWTPPFQAHDGRLKVLWIEDAPNTILPKNKRGIEEWFSIVCVTGPLALKQLIAHSGSEQQPADADLFAYKLRGLPCDAYITDFRLCDKRNEGCQLEEHITVGLHAPSGGFLLGLLTALHWPKHPQSIIPYSGYDEEFGQIWRLASVVCPPTVNVLWDEGSGKGGRDTNRLIRTISPEYRKALKNAFELGLIYMPLAERDRWEQTVHEALTVDPSKLACSKCNGDLRITHSDQAAVTVECNSCHYSSKVTPDRCGDDRNRISADVRLWIVGEYGAREFLIGALFYDLRNTRTNSVPATAVCDWLVRDVPTADPIERQARVLAEWYWIMRRSPLSQAVYKNIRQHHLGAPLDPDLPPNPPGFDSLFKWKKASGGNQLVRLAFLFLLLREHRAQLKPRREALSNDEKVQLDLYKKVSTKYGTLAEMLHGMADILLNADLKESRGQAIEVTAGFEAMQALLNEIEATERIGGMPLFDKTLADDSYSQLIAQSEAVLSGARILQLLNPLPTTWDLPLTLDKGTTIGKALARLWCEDVREFDIDRFLKGQMNVITQAESLAACKFSSNI